MLTDLNKTFQKFILLIKLILTKKKKRNLPSESHSVYEKSGARNLGQNKKYLM